MAPEELLLCVVPDVRDVDEEAVLPDVRDVAELEVVPDVRDVAEPVLVDVEEDCEVREVTPLVVERVVAVWRSTSVRNSPALRTDTPGVLTVLVTRFSNESLGCCEA